MYFLVFRYLQTGGVETLTLREGEWLKKNKGDVCVVTQIITEDMKKLYMSIGVEVIILKKWTAKDIHNAILQKDKNIQLIHMYDLGDFLRYKSHYPKHDIKIIYYCVHPIADCFFKSSQLGKKMFNWIFKKAISTFNRNKNIIYMDEDTLTANLKNYGLEKERELFTTLPLPYKIEKHTIHKRSTNEFKLLTVSRANFPYKGYLLGMLDDLDKYFETNPEFQLTIISRGDDIKTLKERICNLSPNFQKNVSLVEGVNPDKLPEYYSAADLYIGMGTTVLEAADYGVPVIIAKYGTVEFISNGRFDEYPLDLGSNLINGHTGINDIQNVINMDEKEYNAVQNKTIIALRDNYNEDIILEKLDNWKCNYDEHVSAFTNLFFRVYFKLKDLIFE